MKTLILAFTLLALISCEDNKVAKPVLIKVDIKAMPLEADTVTY